MPDHPRVFISYSHDSDAHRERIRDLAARLRKDGIDAWIDQYSPAPAEGWPRWMKAEFARARFVVVVCSAGYAERFDRGPGHGSGVGWEAMLIQQELYEKGGNARFIPVFFDGEEQAVPTELRRFTRHALPTGYDVLLRHLAGRLGEAPPSLGPPPTIDPLPVVTLQSEGFRPGPVVRRVPWNAPPLPDQYLPREELDAFKLSLIAKNSQTIAVAGQHHRLGIQGMPGVGKTLLAAALAWDPEVQDAFAGGVFWITLGRTPDPPVPWQAKLAAYLKGTPVEIDTPRLGKATLTELFAARPPALLILDDVWRVEDADPFNALVFPSRLLITTRNREVASGLGADVRELNELNSKAALALLAAYAGRSTNALPRVAPDIVRECGELPLALAMAGSMLRGRPDDRWLTLLGQLQRADLEYLRATLPDYREHRNMLAAIEVSVQDLPEDVRRRFLDFAVFDEDTAVPESVLQLLWRKDGVELAAAHSTVDALVDRSLVRRDAQGRLTLHDLQHDYVRARGGDIKARHARLLDAYRNTAPDRALHAVTPDGYFFEHIARHVHEGEGKAALRALLSDHRYLAAKLNATGVNALLADFDLLDLASDKPLRLLRDALRLSAHVLSQRPEELPSQLLGRLRGAPETALQYLCARVEADAITPSLLPLWPSLMSPGRPLLRTLKGTFGLEVKAVALSADGKTVVTGDEYLNVWDVQTGRQRRILDGHAKWLSAVALSSDGKVAISGSEDGTLKVWNVETGHEYRALESHAGPVSALVLSKDGKTVISGSHDGLKVSDVETGRVRRTLRDHSGWVFAVALSADGRTAVSSSDDGALKVWDVGTGQKRWTLKGHADWGWAVGLSTDGKTAVAGSNDGTLNIWDVESGNLQRTLKGHASSVRVVVLSEDGKMAVSSSDDGALKVWDMETGRVSGTLGHAGLVRVAASADGRTAISSSGDETTKVWNMEEIGRVHGTLEGHAGSVTAVVLSADGKTAVSCSDDKTLKVWDLETGQERRALKGHAGSVTAVALNADGKTAVSGSDDKTVKVWDVETGQQRRTLEGHEGQVNAVALSMDGRTAVSWSYWTLKVWDVETGQVRRTLEGRVGEVTAVALSADGKTALSISDDTTLKVWDVETGEERHTLNRHVREVTAVAVSTDWKTAVSYSRDTTLEVWDVETGKICRPLDDHSGPVIAVALSADGQTAVFSSYDRRLNVWDLETGCYLASFTGDAEFTALAWDREMRVFAGDRAGRVHLLKLWLGP